MPICSGGYVFVWRMSDAKSLGSAAFKAKEFGVAAEHFTRAIDAGEDEKPAVLYSNRSACYSSQTMYKEALLDANKCIDLDPTWARGHSRRGAAYVGLKNWPSALKSYERGLELDPESANLKAEIATIKFKLSGGSAANQQGGGAQTTTGNSPYPPPIGPMPGSTSSTYRFGLHTKGY